MAIRGSAAWVVVVVTTTAMVVGALLLTVTDPVAQGLFASDMYTSTTAFGSNLLTWVQNLWTYLSAFILIGLLSLVWVTTRRAG